MWALSYPSRETAKPNINLLKTIHFYTFTRLGSLDFRVASPGQGGGEGGEVRGLQIEGFLVRQYCLVSRSCLDTPLLHTNCNGKQVSRGLFTQRRR